MISEEFIYNHIQITTEGRQRQIVRTETEKRKQLGLTFYMSVYLCEE